MGGLETSYQVNVLVKIGGSYWLHLLRLVTAEMNDINTTCLAVHHVCGVVKT